MNLNPSFLLIDLPVFLAQIPSDEPDGGQSKMDSLISAITGFLPVIVFLLFFWFILRRHLNSPLAKSQREYFERYKENSQRLEAILERIATALETKDKNFP